MPHNIPRFGKRYFSLHICEGFTGGNGEANKTLLVLDDALRKMDKTFEGKPVAFLDDHISMADYMEMLKTYHRTGELDSKILAGIVNKSFYNEADGKHWVEFVVWMPGAINACESGMGVSNGYVSSQDGGPGRWHDMDYDVEILDGEYTHLLLTPEPRYTESVTLTPKKFEEYNESRRKELELVNNKAKGAAKMPNLKTAFKILKGEPTETIDFAGQKVVLEKSGKTLPLVEVINMADDMLEKEGSGEMYANADHKVKLHDGSICNVGELVEKYKNSMLQNAEYEKGMADLEKGKVKENKEGEEKKEEEPKQMDNESDEDFEKRKKEHENKHKTNKSTTAKTDPKLEEIRNRVAKLKAGPDNVKIVGGVQHEMQPTIKSKADRLEEGRLALGGKPR
jgi:hypothetical protein